MSHRYAGVFYRLKLAAESLSPAYFSLVMATGIVSIGTQEIGLTRVAIILYWLNIFFYLSLSVLSLLRIVFSSIIF